jgi:hypothetical protein
MPSRRAETEKNVQPEDLAAFQTAVERFGPIPAAGWPELCALLRIVLLSKGATLTVPGDVEILSGVECSRLLRSYKLSYQGHELIRNISQERDIDTSYASD